MGKLTTAARRYAALFLPAGKRVHYPCPWCGMEFSGTPLGVITSLTAHQESGDCGQTGGR